MWAALPQQAICPLSGRDHHHCIVCVHFNAMPRSSLNGRYGERRCAAASEVECPVWADYAIATCR